MKTVLFFFIAIIFSYPIYSQEKEQVNLKETFLDAEYFYAQEAYADALYDYLELYNNGFKDNANINYRIGVCYLNIPGQKQKSIDYLLVALKNVSPKYKESSMKQEYAPIDAWLYLGNAYRVNNMLSKAIETYNKYKELAGPGSESKYADQQIQACNTAIAFMDQPVKIRITSAGDSVNGASSNFKAVVSGNGLVMAYMNELPFYNAVYISRYVNGEWAAPVNITPQIQSDGDQYVSSVSFDGNILYLTREDAFNSDIYTSTFRDGKWSKSTPVSGDDINTKYWESHASISKDGKTVYFTSNRKGGYGEMDIYKSVLGSNGQWDKPVNLGNVINSPLNEDTPFITDNDSLLFFSSQGHENMGGYDIFKSHLTLAGWSQPENLRFPVNTTDDNLFYFPWHNSRVIYASLIRDGGLGKEDIYAIQAEDDKPLPQVMAEVVTPVAAPAEAVKKEPAAAAIPADSPSIPAAPEKPSPKVIDLAPVYFAYDNFRLSPDGEAQLKKIYRLMTDYPAVKIRLIGHADAKGTAEYNLGLSKQRAETAMQYLLDMGIDQARMTFTGMGEKNFVAINSNPDGTDNPEGRQLNRRVEFEIIGTDYYVLTIHMPEIPDALKFKK